MSSINAFLLQNNLRIANSPCVSPDFCLDWKALAAKVRAGDALTRYEKSRFPTTAGEFLLLEDPATGDCAWRLETTGNASAAATLLSDGVAVGDHTVIFPATFANLLRIKNLVQEHDPQSTIFPTAA